jgi:phosphatidylserine decarboxylase
LGTYTERSFLDSKNNNGEGLKLKRGEEMGGFRFGSTVVLVFEAPEGFQFNLKEGQKVKTGEAIGF